MVVVSDPKKLSPQPPSPNPQTYSPSSSPRPLRRPEGTQTPWLVKPSEVEQNVLPIGASDKDTFIGVSDYGVIYETPFKVRYTINPRQLKGQVIERQSGWDALKGVYDAIPPLDTWRLPTGKEAVDFGKGVVASTYNTIDKTMKGTATSEEVMGLALGVGTGGMASSALFRVPEGSIGMFLGPKAAKADLKRLALAKELAEQNVTPETIKLSTGWEADPITGEWHFEISDKDLDVNPAISSWIEKSRLGIGGLSLQEAIYHPKLLEQYPELSRIRVDLPKGEAADKILGPTTLGLYHRDKGKITARMDDKEVGMDTLLHELQHAVDGLENRDSGAHPRKVKHDIESQLDNLPPTDREYFDVMAALRAVEGKEGVFKNLPEETLTDYRTQLKWERNAAVKNLSTPEIRPLLDKLLTITKASNVLPEGFDDYEVYRNNLGEQKANITTGRRNLSGSERFQSTPLTNLDKKRVWTQEMLENLLWDIEAKRNGFAEGGLLTDQGAEMEQQMAEAMPMQEAPPGALEEEVADDQPIMASKGEYVVPADVVRFLGLDYLEKMTDKAKTKLVELDQRGRIGGKMPEEPAPAPEPPAANASGAVPGMAEGGMVLSSTPTGSTVTVPEPITGFSGVKKYRNADGSIMYIPFFEGSPILSIPEGYTEEGASGGQPVQATKTASTVDQAAADKQRIWEENDRRDPNTPNQNNTIAGDPSTWDPATFSKYNRSLGSTGSNIARQVVNTLVPGAKIATNMRDNRMSREVPELIDQQLASGEDLQGRPLTEAQKQELTAAKAELTGKFSNIAERRLAPRTGLLSRLVGRNTAAGTATSGNERNRGTASPTISNTVRESSKDKNEFSSKADATQGSLGITEDEKKNGKENKGGGVKRFASGGLITSLAPKPKMPSYSKGGLVCRKTKATG